MDVEPEGAECDGACFNRAELPSIFGRRTGWGPMRVAWDTNVLIDYAKYLGRHPVGDYEPSRRLDPVLAGELLCLNEFMRMWMVRDIRIYVTGAQAADGELSRTRRRLRDHQLAQIAAALECTGAEEHGRTLAALQAPYWVVPTTLDEADRRIVSEAIRLECEVLLTRDKKILAHRRRLEGLGLRPMTPAEWILATEPERRRGIVGCAHGFVMPDTHKWQHLEAARSLGSGSPEMERA